MNEPSASNTDVLNIEAVHDIEALEKAYVKGTGGLPLPEVWRTVLEFAPEFFSYILFSHSYPWEKGSLSPKEKEFICIGVNAAVSTQSVEGLRIHIPRALDLGATKEEILTVLHIASGMGIHTYTEVAPHLMQICAERNLLDPDTEAAFEAHVDTFMPKDSPTRAPMEAVLRMDPEFCLETLRRYVELSHNGALSNRMRELIIVAYDSSCTHMLAYGAANHIRRALDAGATPQDIVETLILTASIAQQSLAVGVPILIEALAAR